MQIVNEENWILKREHSELQIVLKLICYFAYVNLNFTVFEENNDGRVLYI